MHSNIEVIIKPGIAGFFNKYCLFLYVNTPMNLYDYHQDPQKLAGFYDAIDFLPLRDIASNDKFSYLKDPKYSHKVTNKIKEIASTDFLSPIKIEPGVLITNTAGIHKLSLLYSLSDDSNKQLIISSVSNALDSHMDQILKDAKDPFSIGLYISRWISNEFDNHDSKFTSKFEFPKLKQAMAQSFINTTNVNELAKKFKRIELNPAIIKHIESVTVSNLDKVKITVSEDRHGRGIDIFDSEEMTSVLQMIGAVGDAIRKQITAKVKSCYNNLESDIIKLIEEKDISLENIKLPKPHKIDRDWGDLSGYTVYEFPKLRGMMVDRYHELNSPGYFKGNKIPSDLHDKIKNLVGNMT